LKERTLPSSLSWPDDRSLRLGAGAGPGPGEPAAGRREANGEREGRAQADRGHRDIKLTGAANEQDQARRSLPLRKREPRLQPHRLRPVAPGDDRPCRGSTPPDHALQFRKSTHLRLSRERLRRGPNKERVGADEAAELPTRHAGESRPGPYPATRHILGVGNVRRGVRLCERLVKREPRSLMDERERRISTVNLRELTNLTLRMGCDGRSW
jgi:hypothetical protein